MAELRIGTCSWKFPSWHGLVYSSPKGINYLEEYARHYNTVEIDQWFWSLFGEDNIRLPRPADVEAYRDSVPQDFRFTVKAPNSITLSHFYRKAKTDPLVANTSFLSLALFRTFLALLEMCKLGLIRVYQEVDHGDILISAKDPESLAPAEIKDDYK